ncbi:hypothetical protein K4L06_03280 [Lysobacter sp. BMK333-48F3]|uniref:hypothetical protein n=1 Tax=Lysobacter sp. BMK333-48F3 TaxID=2867962 RepID=UPI001C8C8345|nr:hypothetical protein [Lysobacter sp. BMK333-48F3]MBX9400318.1 hypothetical protein [Lysobacter sp. BMK333-48F3]
MSRIVYTGAPNDPRWSTNQFIFAMTQYQTGGLAPRQRINFGAASAAAILGPDLIMPGAQGNNLPTARGAPWDRLLPGGPSDTFVTDADNIWIRAHLIDGRRGGAGNTWQNLTPLTGVGNANHAAVEGYIDAYLAACYQYEQGGPRPAWYGAYYCAQVSQAPWSDANGTGDTNLYSYAPAFIRISWRAVAIAKPVNVMPQVAAANIDRYPLAGVANFPQGFVLPQRPAVMNGAETLPARGNVAGGAVLGALPANFPAAQANGFDGGIEVHQD